MWGVACIHRQGSHESRDELDGMVGDIVVVLP